MAEVSPPMYLLKRSKSSLMMLVAMSASCHIFRWGDDLRWVLGGCRPSDSERAQLRNVCAVLLRVFNAEFLDKRRAQSLRRRRELSDDMPVVTKNVPHRTL